MGLLLSRGKTRSTREAGAVSTAIFWDSAVGRKLYQTRMKACKGANIEAMIGPEQVCL